MSATTEDIKDDIETQIATLIESMPNDYCKGPCRTALTTNTLHFCISLDNSPFKMTDSIFLKYIIPFLKIHGKVTELELGNHGIGPEGAKAIAEFLRTNKTLTTVNLQWNNIGDEGTKYLAAALLQNDILTTLVLDNNSIENASTESLLHVIKQNKHLTTLSLVFNNIDQGKANLLLDATAKKLIKEPKNSFSINLFPQQSPFSTPYSMWLNEQCEHTALLARQPKLLNDAKAVRIAFYRFICQKESRIKTQLMTLAQNIFEMADCDLGMRTLRPAPKPTPALLLSNAAQRQTSASNAEESRPTAEKNLKQVPELS